MGGVIVLSLVVGWLTPVVTHRLPETLGKLYGLSLLPFLWMFIMAAFVAEFKDEILPFLKKYWWAFIIALLLKRYEIQWDVRAHYPIIDTVLLFCGLLGFSYRIPQVNIKTDISYGIYIYHMTVVNALIAIGFVGQSWTLWLVIALTCLVAWVSTETIGKMSAKKKSNI